MNYKIVFYKGFRCDYKTSSTEAKTTQSEKTTISGPLSYKTTTSGPDQSDGSQPNKHILWNHDRIGHLKLMKSEESGSGSDAAEEEVEGGMDHT